VLRHRLGYRDDEIVCVASAGGSAVGADLLSRLINSYPAAKRQIPRLRMVAVAGPRIDVSTLPVVPGVDVRGFVADLDLHLAACDVALSQGGPKHDNGAGRGTPSFSLLSAERSL
jgi:predicted glycosyltransferase